MSKPGSEPRGTASDEFPTRRVVTGDVQASNIVWVVPSGSGARVKDSGAIAPIGRWISRRDESCRAAIRPHDPSPSGRGQRPTGRAGQLDRGLGFRYPRGRKVRPLRTGINKHFQQQAPSVHDRCLVHNNGWTLPCQQYC